MTPRRKFKSIIWIYIVTGLLLAIFIGLQICYAGKVKIDPPKLIEEYSKFLGSMITVGTGFVLANVLWNRKTREDEKHQSRKNLIGFYTKINLLCRGIVKLLSEEFPIEANEKSEDRDESIQDIMRKIKVIGNGVEKNLPDLSLLEDDALREENVNIWSDILATIETLPIDKDFRVDLDKFNRTVAEILASTQKGIDSLRKN